MEFFRKHGGLVGLGILIALGSFQWGYNRGQNTLPLTTTEIENATDSEINIDFSPFWKAWKIINEKYVPASTTAEMITDEEKLYGAIQGLAVSLGDPYTVFFPPVEHEMFESDIRGNFEGVGMEVLAQEGAITVISPLKGSPASRAGILAGDRVIKINSKKTSNLSTEEAVQLIRGPQGTKVILTIVRKELKDPFDVAVTREVINIPTIATEVLPQGVFKIELYNFSANSPQLFRMALREFVNSNSNKLILDLRGNPGGYLEAAIDMASWFLPSNKVVVKEDFGSSKKQKVYRSHGYDIFTDKLKFVILVDKGSASASEILAGALQEHGKAILVGERTFGKGSVQELVDITRETSLKVTIARWLTPNGLSISETGIDPDYRVELSPFDKANGKDTQFEKALEILRK